MIFVVALKMPLTDVSSARGNASRMTEKTGAPPKTADSNLNFFPLDSASAVNSRYPCTTGPLLAVMACIPNFNAVRMWSRAGCPVWVLTGEFSNMTLAWEC
jgi:hypothetical protein